MAKSRIRAAKNRSDQSEPPPPYALPVPAALVDLVLLGPADDRRQLQDSPVLGDVWMEFAANAASVQDLLATPHKRSTAGDVADLVVDWLDKERTPANAPSHT